jgi:hypothetical protein
MRELDQLMQRYLEHGWPRRMTAKEACSYACWIARTISCGNGAWARTGPKTRSCRPLSTGSSSCRIDWRPSRLLCVALAALGAARRARSRSATCRRAARRCARSRLGYGCWLARREWRRPPARSNSTPGRLLMRAGAPPCDAPRLCAARRARDLAWREAERPRASLAGRATRCRRRAPALRLRLVGVARGMSMKLFQPLSFAIGLRYLRAKRRNGFISFISMASILGILIGVMALITTISVMNGFQEELRDAHPRHGLARHHRRPRRAAAGLAAARSRSRRRTRACSAPRPTCRPRRCCRRAAARAR